MTLARKHQICLKSTPYYHIVNRCVRRAFLCGHDKLTGKDFSHRKQWLVDRIKYLGEIFSIRICAFAVLSNHYHLVLCVDTDMSESWTHEEILLRYGKIHNTKNISALLKNENNLTETERDEITKTVETWRQRLTDISWFERCLNENIARAANKEDETNGRFWHGRFKSQPLLDDAALITCMIYVDLNPIRAGVADSLETSDFTSIQARLRDHLKINSATLHDADPRKHNTRDDFLLPFLNERRESATGTCLPIMYQHYYELIDATGRGIKSGKRGWISEKSPSILDKLGINSHKWLDSVSNYRSNFPSAIGAVDAIKKYINSTGKRKWCVGISACSSLYPRL